jgi:PBP1b-binding outer membrane lipoprotein LpoB
MLKRYVSLLFVTLFLASCVAPRETQTAPSTSPATAATANPTTIPITSTPDKKTFVPKQNDLIFIEFFAVT